MQGLLWSETVRTSEQFENKVFPRLLAVAERAWHRALWEGGQDPRERGAGRDRDWVKFANTLGYKELARLDRMGVKYRVPLAGARSDN